MDTTEEYRAMCEKAEEIERLWTARKGDFIWVKEGDYVDCYNEKEGCIYTVFESEGSLYFDSGISCGRSTDYNEEGYFAELSEVPTAVWLPRQDQLQQIAFEDSKQKYPTYEGGKIARYINLLSDFNDYISFFHSQAILNQGYIRIETLTIEQLWLMFVMNRIYHKSWDGEKWNRQSDLLDLVW